MMAQVGISVERAADAATGFVQDVCVDHRGGDILMAEQLPDGANVVAGLEQVRREAVSEGVAAGALDRPAARINRELDRIDELLPTRSPATVAVLTVHLAPLPTDSISRFFSAA